MSQTTIVELPCSAPSRSRRYLSCWDLLQVCERRSFYGPGWAPFAQSHHIRSSPLLPYLLLQISVTLYEEWSLSGTSCWYFTTSPQGVIWSLWSLMCSKQLSSVHSSYNSWRAIATTRSYLAEAYLSEVVLVVNIFISYTSCSYYNLQAFIMVYSKCDRVSKIKIFMYYNASTEDIR